MTLKYAELKNTPRLLLEAELKPLQGKRFQPTGFADLGAARYTLPDGTEMLLVESAQSVANRMELACWDEAEEKLIPELNGLPYVRVDCGELGKTNTILEFHRLNSPYIWEGAETESGNAFRKAFLDDIGLRSARKKKGDAGNDDVPGLLDFGKFHKAVFKWDTNSVLHGLFLEKVAGRLRMTRALSGFIEARKVVPAESGGVKNDQILPSPKQLGLSADDGFGNVPFHRTEFVAEEIKAYFNIDLALLRGYGLGESATKLLIALALFKIRRFLSTGLRLRTACDLEVIGEVKVIRPEGFPLPTDGELLSECETLIAACQTDKLFSDPAVTVVEWKRPNAGKIELELPAGTTEPDVPDEMKKRIKWGKATKNKGPKLIFPEGLDADVAERAKALFVGADAVIKAIDDALSKQIESPPAENGQDGGGDQ